MFDNLAQELFYRHTISEPKYLNQDEIVLELITKIKSTLNRPNIQSLFDQSYLQQLAAALVIPITGMKQEFIPNYDQLVSNIKKDIYSFLITPAYQKKFLSFKSKTSSPSKSTSC